MMTNSLVKEIVDCLVKAFLEILENLSWEQQESEKVVKIERFLGPSH